MSGKLMVFVALLGASAYALQRSAPPVEPGASAADSAAVAQAGVGARMQYGIGALGSKMVSSSVNGLLHDVEQTMTDLKPALKSARGGEGERAKKTAAKIVQMDSTARIDLRMGRPVKAVRGAMEAKNLVNAIRTQMQLKI